MKARVIEIDALRGLAALTVAFIPHQHYLLGRAGGPLANWPVFSALYSSGWVMVDLFFAISGFIFAHVYLTEGRINSDAASFARARFARLYPLHLVTLLAAALVFASGNPATVDYAVNDARHFVLNLFMLHESGLNAGNSFNIPSWSISVEVICYVAFYIVASRFPRRVVPIAAVLALGGLLATLGTNATVDHIARGFCGFFAGVIAFHWRNASPRAILGVLLTGIVLLAFPIGLNLGAILGLLFFPALVVIAPGLPFLRHRVLTWLGDRSYSLYLVHAPLYMAGNVFLFDRQPVPDAMVWPALIAGWLGVLVVSDASYRYLEMPARRWLNAFAFRARTATA